MAKIKIVYGSVGGNTELVCEKAQEVLEKAGNSVEMLEARLADPVYAADADLLILACPTYGIGELEHFFEIFLGKLSAVDLKGKKCAIIGLGDPKYDKDYHLESIKIIMEFLQKKEAKILHMPLRISKNPMVLIPTGFVDRWAEKINEVLAKN
jgi:flavodoxin I